jgi:hypothetical protein
MSSVLPAFRLDAQRRRDVFSAIAKVRVSLRGLEATLRTNAADRIEIKHVTNALDEMARLENDWAWR